MRIIPGAAIAAAALLLLTACSGGDAFIAKVQSIADVDATEVSVVLNVKNTGSSADAPICFVDLYTAGGTKVGHSGDNEFQSKIQPGKTAHTAIVVDVTAAGEPNVSAADSVATCS